MDAKLKADWARALRSGEYTQHFGNIGKGTNLCCVGVGGAITGLVPDVSGPGSYECWQALGITEDEAQTLFNMNDKLRKTFPVIADYIEANL